MYMDDIKLFTKNKKALETLIRALKTYSENTRKEFGVEICAMLIMKSEKRQMTEETELPNQGKIKMLGEKDTYKYLEILEADTIK